MLCECFDISRLQVLVWLAFNCVYEILSTPNAGAAACVCVAKNLMGQINIITVTSSYFVISVMTVSSFVTILAAPGSKQKILKDVYIWSWCNGRLGGRWDRSRVCRASIPEWLPFNRFCPASTCFALCWLQAAIIHGSTCWTSEGLILIKLLIINHQFYFGRKVIE